MKTRALIIFGLAGLLVIALFAAGMVAGNSLAQDSGGQPDDTASGETKEKNVIIKEVEIEGGPGGGMGFPFESALRKMAENGELTGADVDAIMNDLSELTGAVNYESSTSEDGAHHEVTIDITIDSNHMDALREAMKATLDKAVSAGRLTADQAAAVLAEVDAAPDPLAVPPEGMIHIETIGDHDGADFTAPLQAKLDEAVAAGAVSQSESDLFLNILERLLGE